MRIKEFRIDKYGHIGFEDKFVLKNFTLFWGKNEVGKTLTLEAIIKFILGKHSKIFQNINRIDEKPSGYVVIDSSNGEIKLSERSSLVDLIGIDASVFRNIFIIRNSDLSIENEAVFFKDITDQLTGLNLQKIKNVKSQLLLLGHLTEKFNIKDDQNSGKLATRINEAKVLLEDIEDFFKDAYEKNYDNVEKSIVNLEIEKESLQELVSIYRKVEKRRKYEIGITIRNDYEKKLKEIKRLASINRETEKKLNHFNSEIRHCQDSIDDKKKKINELQEYLNGLRSELSELEVEYEIQKKKKLQIENTILKINRYKEGSKEVAIRKKNKVLIKYSFFISSASLLASLIFAFLGMEINTVMFGAISVASLLFSIINFALFKKRENRLDAILKNINDELAPFNLDADNIYNIEKNVQEFIDIVGRSELKINRKKNDIEVCERQISTLEKESEELNNRITNLKDMIKDILTKAKVEDINDYSKKVEEKGKLEGDLYRLESEFYRVFELNETINFEKWDDILKDYEPFKGSFPDIEYIPGKLDECQLKINEIEKDLQNLKKIREEYTRKFHQFEERANEILLLDEPLRIDSLSQVEKLKNRIEEFLSFHERLFDDCKIAVNILEDIENEKRKRIKELFGEKSKAVEYFKHFSENRYKTISYDLEKNSLHVVGNDNIEIPVENLSAGAYDQLYLAVRLSLAEDILGDEKGFFLMDDPFIKSDPDRLGKEIKILKELAYNGWQIVYFSAKEEILERVKKLQTLEKSLVELYILDSSNKVGLQERNDPLLF